MKVQTWYQRSSIEREAGMKENILALLMSLMATMAPEAAMQQASEQTGVPLAQVQQLAMQNGLNQVEPAGMETSFQDNEQHKLADYLVTTAKGDKQLMTAIMWAVMNRKNLMPPNPATEGTENDRPVLGQPMFSNIPKVDRLTPEWKNALQIVKLVEAGKLPNPVGKATMWFPSNETTSRLQNSGPPGKPGMKPVAEIGGYTFTVHPLADPWRR